MYQMCGRICDGRMKSLSRLGGPRPVAEPLLIDELDETLPVSNQPRALPAREKARDTLPRRTDHPSDIRLRESVHAWWRCVVVREPQQEVGKARLDRIRRGARDGLLELEELAREEHRDLRGEPRMHRHRAKELRGGRFADDDVVERDDALRRERGAEERGRAEDLPWAKHRDVDHAIRDTHAPVLQEIEAIARRTYDDVLARPTGTHPEEFAQALHVRVAHALEQVKAAKEPQLVHVAVVTLAPVAAPPDRLGSLVSSTA
jgi:hypothetical protein